MTICPGQRKVPAALPPGPVHQPPHTPYPIEPSGRTAHLSPTPPPSIPPTNSRPRSPAVLRGRLRLQRVRGRAAAGPARAEDQHQHEELPVLPKLVHQPAAGHGDERWGVAGEGGRGVRSRAGWHSSLGAHEERPCRLQGFSKRCRGCSRSPSPPTHHAAQHSHSCLH